MNLTTEIYLVDPSWFRESCDDIWELRHQIKSFCDSSQVDVSYLFTALQAAGQLPSLFTKLAKDFPSLSREHCRAFSGLAGGEVARDKAAKEFDCALNRVVSDQEVHCASVEDLPLLVVASGILVERYERSSLGELIDPWTTSEFFEGLLKHFAGMTPEENCLVGWTYGQTW